MNASEYALLSKIESPQDLKRLSIAQLKTLASELRDYLIDSVSKSSGHFASGLGVVELTIALHYVFNAPQDHLVFDVGHQAYPHKILTGRRDQLPTIRKKGGLHPFPWRFESDYDVVSTGHSSTSIGIALGLAVADQLNHRKNKSVAIIGDGALTAGMAFEALNQAGELKTDLLVICNDNEMSISQNVGALNQHLTHLFLSSKYNQFKTHSKKVLDHFNPIKELLKKTEHQLKSWVAPSSFVEELGFNYIGPVDGHDLEELVQVLEKTKALSGPRFLHVKTKKGKGYLPAEQDPIRWHGVSAFDKHQGVFNDSLARKTVHLSFSNLFGVWACQKAQANKQLIAITPAMKEGSGLVDFAKSYPDRFFDVGIAEQHAVTFASGLALAGMKPIVAIYSSFLQRAYDQVIHDIAIQNVPVLFVIDRAGIVGEDGPTHQGAFDLSYLNVIPNLVIMAPSSSEMLIKMLNTGIALNAPAAIRFPKAGSTIDDRALDLETKIEIGKAKSLCKGQKVALLNFGTFLPELESVAKKINATLIDMRFIKPLDEGILKTLSESHSYFVTVEENSIIGGAGSAVNQFVLQNQLNVRVLNVGLPDHFIEQGQIREVKRELGLTANQIETKIIQFMREPL